GHIVCTCVAWTAIISIGPREVEIFDDLSCSRALWDIDDLAFTKNHRYHKGKCGSTFEGIRSPSLWADNRCSGRDHGVKPSYAREYRWQQLLCFAVGQRF